MATQPQPTQRPALPVDRAPRRWKTDGLRRPSVKFAFGASAFAVAAAVLASAGGAQPLPKQRFPYKSGPVTITSCTLNENKSNSTVTGNSLRINYFPNETGKTLTSITFRVRYAGTPVTVTDTGTFGYNAPITHQFDQLGGHAWAGASPEVCRVVTATFSDGTVVNPTYDGPGDDDSMHMPPAAVPSGAPGATSVPAATATPAAPAPAAT